MATKQPTPRLEMPSESALNNEQQELVAAISAGPRGKFRPIGPFAIWLHAPSFGKLAQQLGAHCRYKTALSPRLSEFAILTTARHWRAQYEWFAHAPMAEKAGVKPKTIADLRAGRYPKSAPADERALYDFIIELYAKKRVGNRNYARVGKVLGQSATVELIGILGYYAMISMTLNVFRAPLDEGHTPPFAEPKV